MINKAVFSYFNTQGLNNTSGFLTFRDMLGSTVLAMLTANKHFSKVEFVTNKFGEKIVEVLKIPVSVSLKLEEMNEVSPYFWAYAKILATSSQNEPFVHIDNDAYLFSGLPQRMKNADIVFQSKEFMDRPGYGWYDVLKPCWKDAPVKPKDIVSVTDYAYNCGICGGNNIDFFKLHRKVSSEYIFAPENQTLFFEKHKEVLIHQNLFHEQYFIASLIKSLKLRNKVEVFADNIEGINTNGISYCHLWGLSKRNHKNINKMWARLNKDFPVYYNKIKDLNLNLLIN
jgi:hypothetical protein